MKKFISKRTISIGVTLLIGLCLFFLIALRPDQAYWTVCQYSIKDSLFQNYDGYGVFGLSLLKPLLSGSRSGMIVFAILLAISNIVFFILLHRRLGKTKLFDNPTVRFFCDLLLALTVFIGCNNYSVICLFLSLSGVSFLLYEETLALFSQSENTRDAKTICFVCVTIICSFVFGNLLLFLISVIRLVVTFAQRKNVIMKPISWVYQVAVPLLCLIHLIVCLALDPSHPLKSPDTWANVGTAGFWQGLLFSFAPSFAPLRFLNRVNVAFGEMGLVYRAGLVAAYLLSFIILFVLVLCLIQAGKAKRFEKFAVLVSLCLSLVVYQFLSKDLNGTSSLSSSLFSLLLIIELLRSMEIAPLSLPHVPFKVGHVLRQGKAVLFCLFVISSAGAMTGVIPSDRHFLNLLPTDSLLASKPSEIPEFFGARYYGLDQESTLRYVVQNQKASEGVFGVYPKASSYLTTYYLIGSNGIPAPYGQNAPDPNHWMEPRFNVMLNSLESEHLWIGWYIVDGQLGGTMDVYIDGEFFVSHASNQNFNYLSFDGFERNQNYSIGLYFDKEFTPPEKADLRKLGFVLFTLEFNEEALW